MPSTISQNKAVFVTPDLTLDLRYVVENTNPGGDGALPQVGLEFLDLSIKGHKGLAVQSNIRLEEGQCVTFILRTPPARGTAIIPVQNNVTTERIIAGTETKEWRVATDNVPRAMDDPLLTKELLAALLHVRCNETVRILHVLISILRQQIGIGTSGYRSQHTRDLGRRRSCAVPLRSSF